MATVTSKHGVGEDEALAKRLAQWLLTEPKVLPVALALAKELAEDEDVPADQREVCARFVAEHEETS